MNLFKLEPPATEEARKEVANKILTAPSCLVIFLRDGKTSFQWFNMSDSEVIACLEIAKIAAINDMD